MSNQLNVCLLSLLDLFTSWGRDPWDLRFLISIPVSIIKPCSLSVDLFDHIMQPGVNKLHEHGRINLHFTYVDSEAQAPAIRKHSYLKEGLLVVVGKHD